MDHELSEETRRRIAEHCRRISVAHNLDPEIQRELAGHMEDKILGYLSGQEPLTEEDAFVIARERFGDPALIKEMLGATHAGEAAVSLRQKFLAITLLESLFALALSVFQIIALLLVKKTNPTLAPGYFIQFFLNPLTIVTLQVLLFLIQLGILRRWKRRMAEGFMPWPLRQPVMVLIVLLITMLFMKPLLKLPLDILSGVTPGFQLQFHVPSWYQTLFLPIIILMLIANVILWLWWCDCEPRRPQALRQAALWFAAFTALVSFIDGSIQRVPATAQAPHYLIFKNINGWSYYWQTPTLSHVTPYLVMFLIVVVLALLGWGLYEQRRKKMAPHSGNGDDPLVS